MMRYLSVCSGIEAATVAWKPLGWQCEGVAEIDPSACDVLRHHYPSVPNHGDFTKIEATDRPIDLLVGGTPCQDFSIAGKRIGLDGARGNLSLEYLRLARRLRARWLVWENVPGVLSTNGGRDFGAFLGLLGECGYGFAYRVLDAQYIRVDGFLRAVPQRRRRVILVGHLGDWRRAAAVLFEPEGMRGDPAPRREAREGIAAPIAAGSPGGSGYRNDADTAENLVARSLNAHPSRSDGESETFVVAPPLTHNPYGDHESREGLLVAHSLTTSHGTTEDGTGRGTPIIPIGLTIHGSDGTTSTASYSDVAAALRARIPGAVENSTSTAVLQPIAFDARQSDVIQYGDIAGPIDTDAFSQGVHQGWAVRRLTPLECERLQGFPDGYTAVPRGNRGTMKDGPRYKALGNSMAVNVMRWVGRRIALADVIQPAQVAA